MAPTEEARIAEIAAKVEESTETYAIPWQNDREALKVINLSLDSVLLNPKSHRIRAQIESHPQADILKEDPFSDPAQRIIEGILADTLDFGALVDSLRESGQRESGIITHAGMLVNANTRAVAMRQLHKDYIRVGVLPSSAVELEITELEARLQLARDLRQKYTLTNELLFIQEQLDIGKTPEDLALLLGKAQSRNRQHLQKGVTAIEQSLRILHYIREVQEKSGGTIPLTFFDEHESALTEADRVYSAIRNVDPHEARRVRDGRMAGVLVEVPYRRLRNWDSDRFLKRYVEPEFEGDEALSGLTGTSVAEESSGDLEGLDILEGASEPAATGAVDPSELLETVARHYRTPTESEVGGGMTRAQLYEEVQRRLTQAAEEQEEDKREEKKQSTPIILVRQARQRLDRARESLSRAALDGDFEHGNLRYEMRLLRRALDALSEAAPS